MTRGTDKVWFLYVIRCRNGSLYTGISPDVDKRFQKHVSGQGARYLRGRGPLTLVATGPVGDRSAASRAEHAFRQLDKTRKEAVLSEPSGLSVFVERGGF